VGWFPNSLNSTTYIRNQYILNRLDDLDNARNHGWETPRGPIYNNVGCHRMGDLFTISVFHDITEILLDVTLNTYDPWPIFTHTFQQIVQYSSKTAHIVLL
jgi:hypothetical protein